MREVSLEKTYSEYVSANFKLKAIQIKGQWKIFYKQRIPESSCVRKETVDIDILVTSSNGDRKIMQSIGIPSRTPSRKRKRNQLSQFFKNIYQSNTYRKDLSWPHFSNELRVEEKQQVKGQQSCIFVFAVCLTIPSTNQGYQPRHDNSIPSMGVWQIYRDTEQPQEKETSYNEIKLQFWQTQFQQQR